MSYCAEVCHLAHRGTHWHSAPRARTLPQRIVALRLFLCYTNQIMNATSKLFFSLVAAAVLLGAGYAAGHYFAEPVVEVLPVTGETATVTVRDGVDAAALAKALSEVAALKAENAALRKDLEASKPMEEAPVAEAPRRLSWRERMEEMKKTNPERYKQEMERREQFRLAIAQARAERVSFLDSVDPALFSAEGREVHARYTEALARQAELEEQLRAAYDAGEQPSQELAEAMRENWRILRETGDSERVALLDAIASSMGLSGRDAEDFRKLVDDVYNATGHGPRRPPTMMLPAAPAGGNRR